MHEYYRISECHGVSAAAMSLMSALLHNKFLKVPAMSHALDDAVW